MKSCCSDNETSSEFDNPRSYLFEEQIKSKFIEALGDLLIDFWEGYY